MPSETEIAEILAQKEKEGGAFETPPVSLGNIGKSERLYNEKKQAADELYSSIGDKEFFVTDLPSEGRFYPTDMKIFIRAARGEEIKHYSTLDERDFLNVEDHLNDIVLSCSKISCNGRPMSYKDLLEADRIKLILAIKDLTFKHGENKIMLKPKCEKCGTINDVELQNHVIGHQKSDIDLEHYYSEIEKLYVIKTKSYGEIRLKPPTVGLMQVVYGYIKDKENKKEKWDKAFMQVFPYMQTDWRGLNSDAIFKKSVDFVAWDDKKYSLVYRLIEKMKIGINPDIVVECSNCGAEVTTQFDFPLGFKSIFINTNIDDELI